MWLVRDPTSKYGGMHQRNKIAHVAVHMQTHRSFIHERMNSLILKYTKLGGGKIYLQEHMGDMQMNVYTAFYLKFIVTSCC